MDAYDIQFVCGKSTSTHKFNGQTKIEQVYEYVRKTFAENLPSFYRISYYDPNTKSFDDLEVQLQNGSNPFHSNSSNGKDCIHFYVVSLTPCQTGSDDDQIVSSSSCDESISSTNDRSLIVIPSVTNLAEVQNRSKRLRFALDVKPYQRDIYKSDQFNVREDKSNGRIARVQGWKRDEQRMLQVLPRLQIPSIDLQSNGTLLVAVVSEVVDNGEMIWYKHPHKGFLPERYEKHTEPMNPITFDLNRNNMSNTGEFTLSLQMITKWNKSQVVREEVYRLNEGKARVLHPAEHEDGSPRLLCVLQRKGVIDWETCCLSDFIRTPKSSKARSSSTGRDHSPKQKRSKIKD